MRQRQQFIDWRLPQGTLAAPCARHDFASARAFLLARRELVPDPVAGAVELIARGA
jgi:hypothetical protein